MLAGVRKSPENEPAVGRAEVWGFVVRRRSMDGALAGFRAGMGDMSGPSGSDYRCLGRLGKAVDVSGMTVTRLESARRSPGT